MQPPLNIDDQKKLIEDILRRRSFNGLSDRFATVLTELWLIAGKAAVEAISSLLRGKSKFTANDFKEVLKAGAAILSSGFGSDISPIVQNVSIGAYGKGLNEIRAGLSKSFSLVDRQAVSFIHEHHMYWSLNHYDRHVTDRLKRLSEAAIKNGLSRADAGRFFANTIGEELQRSASYWELTADAITTRSRSFSNISGLERIGATVYEWDSVVDHRTSDICLYLDGKQFRVEAAAEVRNAMLEAETPEKAKEIMPWLPEDQVVDTPISQLESLGVVLPPAHGNCRARIVIA